MGKQKNVKNVQNGQIDQILLDKVQEYLTKRAAIVADATDALANETDPEKLLARCVKPSEQLYKLNVEIRNTIGDLTKECIGQSGSIADQAVKKRKELYAKKAETKEAEKAEK